MRHLPLEQTSGRVQHSTQQLEHGQSAEKQVDICAVISLGFFENFFTAMLQIFDSNFPFASDILLNQAWRAN